MNYKRIKVMFNFLKKLKNNELTIHIKIILKQINNNGKFDWNINICMANHK